MSDSFHLVAAIDFGTTYSGYAFSTTSDYKKDPLKIHANQAWVSGGKYLLSLKTPTCLLLDEGGNFLSFGFDAENKYANLILDENPDDCYYFSRFKMKLHRNTELSKEMLIEDISGKKFSALKVFALSIKALKDHLMTTLDKQGYPSEVHEIQWVLTVPAIWNDSAKQFMREAAKEGGIPDHCLLIALEPEAASIYCQHLPIEKLPGATKGFSVSEEGTKYMVIDLGGGTADITVHEKLHGMKLRELYKASGGACGGTSVDSAFLNTLKRILGGPFIHQLQTERTSVYIDLVREFETVKRTVKPDSTDKVNLTIPYVSLNELCNDELGEDFDEALNNSPFSNRIKRLGDKLRMDADTMKEFFRQTVEDIVKHIQDIMSRDEARGVTKFLMVGGFSESLLIQDSIRKAFPSMRIIIPDEAGLSVLKGAVIFGHQPKSITSRISKVSYGVRVTPEFDASIHQKSKKFKENNVDRCADVFGTFCKAGRSIPVDHKCLQVYSTTRPMQDSMPVIIYTSESEDPEYVTDPGCTKLGVLDVEIPLPSEDTHHVAVSFQFGDTELKVDAVEVESKCTCSSKFSLI